MGGARWSDDDYKSYATRTNYVTASRDEVFVNRNMPQSLDPSKIRLRESCDSEQNPNSTPLIFALDVTGSMGQYAELIAKEGLPELMSKILEVSPVQDPHLMFMGLDDVHAHSPAPLQVSQFEADIRILEQLREIYLVGRGGGNSSESYDLPWYFAANKTKIDSLAKRGKKGYLFTFGDEEAPYETVSARKLESVFGPGQYKDMTPAESLAAAQEKYEVFHIVIEQGNYCRDNKGRVYGTWTELLGNRVLFLKDFRNLTELVIATLKISEGADIQEVIRESANPKALEYAFRNALQSELA